MISRTTQAQRDAFEKYMENGGGWLGFHVAGYNDRTTNWPWFVNFLGGAVFYKNNWPPLPAKLTIDDTSHPVTKGLPQHLFRLLVSGTSGNQARGKIKK